MKLLILSDLHIEHSPFTPDKEATAAADVVVLAGDIHAGDLVAAWARETFPDKPIVLVAGNHELYDGHWERTLDVIRESSRRHEVHFLENVAVTLGGIRFLGATLWTDYTYFGEDRMDAAMASAQRIMPDYRVIEGCTPERTIERHRASRAWLEHELSQSGPPAVVVTHHYPRKDSTPARFQEDLCTAAFGSQLPTELLDRARLWVHGHTHNSFDYRVGDCRVLCNPRGYPRRRIPGEYENPAFNPGLLVDLVQEA